MSYQQKKTLVSVVSGIILFISYCVLILPKYQIAENSSDLKFWAISILSFIGVSIVVNIIIQIIFHILLSVSIAVKEQVKNEIEKEITGTKSNEKTMENVIDKKIKMEMIEDERDKMIELKSLRVGYYISGVGIIASIFVLVIGLTPAIMLNVLFLSVMLGAIVEGIVQYYFYSKDN
jgi:hypothetical protein